MAKCPGGVGCPRLCRATAGSSLQLERGEIHVGHGRSGRNLLLMHWLGRLLISSCCWSLSLIILLNEYLHPCSAWECAIPAHFGKIRFFAALLSCIPRKGSSSRAYHHHLLQLFGLECPTSNTSPFVPTPFIFSFLFLWNWEVSKINFTPLFSSKLVWRKQETSGRSLGLAN